MAFNEAYAIFTTPEYKTKEGWKKEAEEGGATVHSKVFKFGKLFALSVRSLRNRSLCADRKWSEIPGIVVPNSSFMFATTYDKLARRPDSYVILTNIRSRTHLPMRERKSKERNG